MSEETNDTKITSVEKSKDPRRVEAGKKLGAISRQAKEKKASGAGKVEAEFGVPTFDPFTAIGIVGVVGMVAYYGYCGCYRSSKESPKESQVVQAKQANREDCEAQVVRESPEKRKSPARKELDTLDFFFLSINEF